MRIGFIGLGKLGLPCAAAMSVKNNIEVFGYDPNPAVKNYVSDAQVPYLEKDISYYLQNARIRVLDSVRSVVESSEIIFVAVQTPHEKEYEGTSPTPKTRRDFDYSFLKSAISEISDSLKIIQKRVTVVVISTVLPGTMRSEVFPILETVRGQVDFCYNPYFIAMGQTIEDFLNPEFILIGSDGAQESEKLVDFYRRFQTAPIKQMQIESAELTKVAYNTFIGFKIVFGNTLGEICDELKGNVDEITDALSLATDRLISGKYLRAGMADGGGCHPRDQIAMSFLAKKLELSTDPFTWLAESRDKQTKRQAELILEILNGSNLDALVILGESYKSDINLVVGSPSLLLQHFLREFGIKFEVYDPHVYPNKEFPRNPAVFFIATNHTVFGDVKFPDDSIIIDPWGNAINSEIQDPSIEILRIGRYSKSVERNQ